MSEKNNLQEYCQKNKLGMPKYESWSSGESHRLQWSARVTIIKDKKEIIIDTIVPVGSKVIAEKQAAALMMDHLRNKNKEHEPSLLTKLKDATKLNIISTHPSNKKEVMIPNEKTKPTEPVESSDEDILEDKDSREIGILATKNDIEEISGIYLIDLENKPCFSKTADLKKNSIYIGFINSIHHSVAKYENWHRCNTDNIAIELVTAGDNKLLYLVDGGTPDLADHFMTAMLYPVVEYIKKTKITPKIYIVSGDHAGWCTRGCLEKILKWNKISDVEINNTNAI